MRWIAVKVVVALSALIAAAALSTYLLALRSLPTVTGTLAVSGLTGPVEILRDVDSIPHIFANGKTDALFGLGYVHAQDRLWQMEFQRRVGHGRLSEIFGSATLAQDRFLRTVGFGRAARSAWERLSADTRRQIDGYVAGINAFLASHRGSRLPPEFAVLGVKPEPWTGPDVLVWIKMMSWDLSENYRYELLRLDIEGRLGPEAVEALMPSYPLEGLTIVGPSTTDGGVPTLLQRARVPRANPPAHSYAEAFARALSDGNPSVRQVLLGGTRVEGLGSNNWVVGGALTASGQPLLANDPHLGSRIPSIWYLAHMSAGDFDVIGATLPGVPAVAIGRNRFIAWGETNVGADVEDLFRERVDASGTAVEFRGAMEPLTMLTEVIEVKGQEPVEIPVRISRHGPLVSDAINANNASLSEGSRPGPLEPLALRWTALDDADTTITAFLQLNEARNWAEFTAALRSLVAPSQNFVYADVEGHIGYYAPGRIPLRTRGDGSSPAEGWTGEMDWSGWIPFDDLPHVLDPPEHFIVTANHRPAPADYPYLIGLDFPEPYRAQRMTDLLAGAQGLTPDDFRSMQGDTLSLHAETLLPVLLQRARPETSEEERAIELLRAWDRESVGNSVAATLFQAWFIQLAPTLVGDDLGESILRSYQGRFSYVTRFARQTLESDQSPWCDDLRTPARETCQQAVTAALRNALAGLRKAVGPDMSRWRWEDVHRAIFPHQGLDAVRALRPLLSRSFPSAGDWSTVNVGPVSVDEPFKQYSVPSYRQIIDLSPSNDSRFLDAVGQSGHFLSKHYDDFLDDWHHVKHRAMRMDRAEIEDGATGRLWLTPGPSP